MSKQTFVANTILTAAQMNTLQTNDYNQTVSTKTASYTLVAADAGTTVVMNAAGATTITVNTSLFTAGDTLKFSNIGAGVCTVTAGTATVSSAGPLAIPQYGGGTLYFTSAGVSVYFPTAVTAAAAAAGLTFIAGGSVSAETTLTISNCFTSTYDNYKMIISNYFTSVAGYNLWWRFGTGTADSTSGYIYTTVSGAGVSTNTYGIIANTSASGTGRKGGINIEMQSPNLAQPTNLQAHSSSFGSTSALGFSPTVVQKPTTDQYTSLYLLCETPETFTFDYKIYGYANS